MKRTMIMKWIKSLPVLLFSVLVSLSSLANNDPADSIGHTTSRFDSLVEEGAAKLRALIQANKDYEAIGQTDKLQYIVRVGFNDTPSPFDSTFFQRNASGAAGYFEPGNLLFTIISDSLRKWNTENTVKSYMLYVNGLFFGLDKNFEYQSIGHFFNSPNAQFRVNTNKLKEAHADITNAIFNKVATTDALRRTTVLFSIGSYQSNVIFKEAIKSNGLPSDSTWVQTHLLLTAHPKANNLAETDDRKKLITLVHNAMLYEKPAFTNSRDAINDERMVIGGALKRMQKHKQILISTTPNQLDDIFKDFQQSDYMALTLPERVHALKVMAGSAMGNNMYNSREAYAVMMVQHTPDEQQKRLLDTILVVKATGSSNVLLKDLVTNIDNGHFLSESNDLDEFVTSLAKFIYLKMPPGNALTIDSILIGKRTIGIKPGFWFGDAVSQKISSAGIVELENFDRQAKVNLPAYDYVYLVFNGTFTLGDKTYTKNERALVPAIIAQLVFNNHNSSKIKAGLKTVFDLALLLTGVGEIRLALEAGKAWPVAKAVWNMGWAASDFFINGVLAEKLAETESGRKFLMWYNRVQLIAGGLGMAVSIYDIRQGIKNSRKEFEQDLVDNKLKRELEYGTSEVQVTNAEKDDIINNLKKEEDEAAKKLNIVEYGYGVVTKSLMKQKMPTDFLDALKSLGKTEDEILEYFVKYHNDNGLKFLSEIDQLYIKYPNLTKAEVFSIWGYTTDHFYYELNDWLRNGVNSLKTEKLKTLLNAALTKVPKYNGTAYRAIKLEGQALEDFVLKHKVGEVITYDEFVSCGSNTGAAFFNKPQKNIHITIEVKDVPVISDFSDGIKFRDYDKDELLIFTGKKFKVIYNQPENGIQKISLIQQ